MSRLIKQAVSTLLAAALVVPTGWFGPTATAEASTGPKVGDIVMSSSFDTGTDGWFKRGSETVTHSTETAQSGSGSLLTTGRSATWNGPGYNANALQPGATYEFSIYAKLKEEPANSVNLELAIKQEGLPQTADQKDDPETYKGIKGATVNAEGWVQLIGEFTVDPRATGYQIYVQATNHATVDYYIDTFSAKLTALPASQQPPASDFPKQIHFYDFENGTQGWAARGGGAVSRTTEGYDNSTGALFIQGRTANWHGPSVTLATPLAVGAKYEISAYVKLPSGASTGKVKMTGFEPAAEGNSKYHQIVGETDVTDTQWVLLKSTDFMPAFPTTEIYLESPDDSLSFIVDNVQIVQTAAAPGDEDQGDLDQSGIQADFEDNIGQWIIRSASEGAAIERTTAANHTTDGTASLKATVATQYNGPILDVLGKMHRGHKYRLSAWVRMAPGQDPTSLRISVQSGDSTYTNVSANVTATDERWVELTGEFSLTVTPPILKAYVETAQKPAAPVTFYMDDFMISHIGALSAPKPIENIPAIKDVYKDMFLIGNAIGDAEFEGLRLELLKKHHNVVTAENAMKPDYAYDSDRAFDFTAEDRLVEKIEAAGLKLHGHVLVWHQQMPTWLSTAENGSPLSPEVARANLRTHIETVINHFGPKVISWDVVNEAMSDNPPNPANWKASLRSAPWKAALGDNYVEEAFLIAREVVDKKGWNIKLYYNDYNDDNQNKATAIANMVKEINDRYAEKHPGKLLIDGVGMQAHYNISTKPENVESSLKRFIDLGVEVSITEIDITAGDDSKLTDKQAKAQGYLYAQLMNLYKKYSEHIARVTFWGLDDGKSWRSENSPLLFDKDLQAKPAYYGVIDPNKFMAENPPEVIIAERGTAQYGTPTIDGEVDAIWSNTSELRINKFQMAWQGAQGIAKALWDDEFLYVLFQVNNAELDKSHANPWEHDSVEVFLDQNNAKSSVYQSDDGQYRVNYNNEASFSSDGLAEGFQSAVKLNGTHYTVEMKIPLKHITPANDHELGFDVQINDAKAGTRQSVATWNDLTGQGFQDPSVFGVLTLKGKSVTAPTIEPTATPAPTSRPTDTTAPTSSPSPSAPAVKKDTVVIEPEVKVDQGRTKGVVTGDAFNKALEQAAPAANGKKQMVIELPKQANTSSYEVQLPVQALKANDTFVLVMKTENAAVQLPSNMLSNVTADVEQVSIRVEKAVTDSLEPSVQSGIGTRPVIQIHVVAGDNVIQWNNPAAPVTISIPYSPTVEERSKHDQLVIWYIDANGQVTPVPNARYDAASQAVVFQTTHFSTYAVAFVPSTFEDLNHVPWAKQAIDAMAAREIIKGVGDNRFSPESTITRADFVALLVRALELRGAGRQMEMFSDVPANAYYYNELRIARELGIASGYGDQTFKPDSSISRQDMMVMTARALSAAGKQLELEGDLSAISDVASISEYARDSAAALAKAGIVVGSNGKLAPKELLTRAQAAVILYRIWSK